eukprot:2402178-Pyramimonas_sp.AAC.1
MIWLIIFLVRAAGMCTYVHLNCQSAELERLGDISDEFKLTDIIAVTSTGERAQGRDARYSDLRFPGGQASKRCGGYSRGARRAAGSSGCVSVAIGKVRRAAASIVLSSSSQCQTGGSG